MQIICKQDKEEHNIKNQYNQNFKGLYCVCERPYPDPEDEVIIHFLPDKIFLKFFFENS